MSRPPHATWHDRARASVWRLLAASHARSLFAGDMARASWLATALLALSPSAAALTIGGVRTKRVQPSPELPWVIEADWQTSTGTVAIRQHDPLSSCYWPAAAALARLVHRLGADDTPRQSFLDLGCGTGLCSLTAAACGALSVIATDVSETSLEFTSAAAEAQGLSAVQTRLFDATALDAPLPAADVLMLSDVFVTDALATAFAARVAEAEKASFARVLIVDPGRSTRDVFLAALDAHGVQHDGFADEATCLRRARAGARVLCLDTSEGAPVSYCI